MLFSRSLFWTKEVRFLEIPDGTIAGNWTILSRAENGPNGQGRFNCRCKCGVEKIVGSRQLRVVVGTGCRSCSIRVPVYFVRKKGNSSARWRGCGEVSLAYFNSLKRGASGEKSKSHRVLDFSVTIEELWDLFLQQDRRCALSGVGLVMFIGGTNRGTASVDRIDSAKGYVQGNLQWIHKDLNMMKWTYQENHFIDLCKAVAEHCGGGACEIL